MKVCTQLARADEETFTKSEQKKIFQKTHGIRKNNKP